MNVKNQLKEMQEFLASKKQLGVLAQRAGVSLGTVYGTFDVEDFESLKGKQLTVYQTAVELINEIKSLPAMAAEALNK